MAVEWTRHALGLDGLEINGFLDRFGLEFGRIARGHRDLTTAQAMAKTHDMHVRHGKAVRQVLKTCISDQAAAIAGQALEPTSLLALHIGGQPHTSAVLPVDPRDTAPEQPVDIEGPERDLVPDAYAPLQAAFYQEDDRHVVAVAGLGRVVGAPAKVAHGLKSIFDEDRQNGLAPEDHRYTRSTRIPLHDGISKAGVRRNIMHCRKSLAEFYRATFGADPPGHLLIQNKPSMGYRLDPELVMVSRVVADA